MCHHQLVKINYSSHKGGGIFKGSLFQIPKRKRKNTAVYRWLKCTVKGCIGISVEWLY